VAKVVANLQLFIEKIHIRYEDDTQSPEVTSCDNVLYSLTHAFSLIYISLGPFCPGHYVGAAECRNHRCELAANVHEGKPATGAQG
jgi:hypothetical protein